MRETRMNTGSQHIGHQKQFIRRTFWDLGGVFDDATQHPYGDFFLDFVSKPPYKGDTTAHSLRRANLM